MLANLMVWWHKRNLFDEKPSKVCTAIAGLTRVRDSQVPGLLIDCLGHRDVRIRDAAAIALGRYGETSLNIIHALTQSTLDRHPEVRKSAVISLGKLGDKQALPALHRSLGDADSEVRHAAAQALIPLGEPEWQNCVKGSEDDFCELGLSGDKRAVPALILAAKNPKPHLRLAAIFGLSKLGDKQALMPILQALEESEQAVRLTAVEAIAALRDPMSLDALVRMLKHRDPDTRATACKALGLLHDARAIGPLHKCLEDPDESVCQAAVEALSHFGQTPARSRPSRQEVFAGRLGVLDVAKIMSMVEPLRLTGALRVADGRLRIGHVHFINGAVRHADLHDLEGPDALFQLFHFTKGAFRFDLTPATDKQTIEGNTMALLLEGLRKIDEAKMLVDSRRKAADSSGLLAAETSASASLNPFRAR